MKIAKAFRCSVEQLLDGVDPEYSRLIKSGAMVVEKEEADEIDGDPFDVSGHKRDDIPVIAEGDATPQGGLFWDDEGLVSDVEDRLTRPYDVRDPKAYGVRVRGDSMMPAYKPGMVLVVSPNIPVANGDEVYVQLLSGERLLKVATRMRGGWLLESINPAYESRFVKKSEVGSMHPIVWARRKR